MNIFVGSTNPVKLNAVTAAAIETWPDVVVKGFEVASSVSNQPMTDEETRLGAENRAMEVLKVGADENRNAFTRPGPGYPAVGGTGSISALAESGSGMTECLAIGIEGGVFEHAESGELWNTVWACVADQSGHMVCANGERFKLPDSLSGMIRSGKEMGPAMDELIGSTNIKHHEGMIGVITKRFIDRTEMYAGLVKLAIGLWYGRETSSKL